ncbi:hypothetical protein GmHk_01G000548 [Glycine max]|nr:hypothetical protein GmHk_01G000548 [Glycine max]
MQMVDRGRGGGHRTFNRGFSLGAPITTNPSPSSIHISTSESMIHVIAQTPNILPTTQDQPNPTFVRESIPTTPVRDASPLAPDDFVTSEYPPDPNCEHIVDERPFIRAYKGEFQPTYGCSNIISNIIREKFDEPAPTYCGGSISTATHFEKPPTVWEVIEKTKKLKSGEWVNDKSCEFVRKAHLHKIPLSEEGTSTQDSSNTATSVNDNEIYLNVVGGPNYKGNMYGLGTLSKRFSCLKSAPSTSIAPSIIIK